MASSETILVPPLASLLPGIKFLDETNCVDLTLNYSLTGGSFSISMLSNPSFILPGENSVLSMPFGSVGTVKSVGNSSSRSGLVDTISGPLLPLFATLVNFAAIQPGKNSPISQMARAVASPVGLNWGTLDVPIKNFSFRGQSLSGVTQLAAYLLADIIIRGNSIFVVDPGSVIGSSFIVQPQDIVSVSQVLDSTLDIVSVLNPALSAAQLDDQGDFVYDSDHAQKQPKFTVQTGAPGSQGSTDFIPIPDGWLVDGNYEEWIPPSTTDFTNPNASVPSGRYWKVFQSPTNPNMMRGITNFTRLVKEIKIPGNVSTFVGSPITGVTKQNTSREFGFDFSGTESGIYGFSALDTILFDVISHQQLELANAIVLVPQGGVGSSDASSNFYTITMELWTFPRVNPQKFPVGDPTNPYGLPKNTVIINPNSNVVNTGGGLTQYYNKYVQNFKRINSPRLKTNVSCVYRNTIPQPGDSLTVMAGTRFSKPCGRVQSVSMRFGRTGLILNIAAEIYQYGGGLYQQ